MADAGTWRGLGVLVAGPGAETSCVAGEFSLSAVESVSVDHEKRSTTATRAEMYMRESVMVKKYEKRLLRVGARLHNTGKGILLNANFCYEDGKPGKGYHPYL